MELNNSKIDDFLNGKSTDLEKQDIKNQMKNNPILAQQLRSRKLELLMEKELERKAWQSSFDQFEADYQAENESQNAEKDKTAKIVSINRRWIGYAVAASLGVVLLFNIPGLIFEDKDNLPIAESFTKDFNLEATTKLQSGLIQEEELIGQWQATIEEKKGVGLSIIMDYEEEDEFRLIARIILNNQPQERDKLEVRGTWSIEGKQLTLDLDKETIETEKGTNPFQSGIVELWLHNNRLFKKSVEIVSLTPDFLILKLNQRHGIEWQKLSNNKNLEM